MKWPDSNRVKNSKLCLAQQFKDNGKISRLTPNCRYDRDASFSSVPWRLHNIISLGFGKVESRSSQTLENLKIAARKDRSHTHSKRVLHLTTKPTVLIINCHLLLLECMLIFENRPSQMKFFGVKKFFSFILISKMGVKRNLGIIMKNHAADSDIGFPTK